MFKTYLKWSGILVGGLLIGLGIGYLFFYVPLFAENQTLETVIEHSIDHKQVIGFLPYWLLSKAQMDYSPYINTLTYFGLTIDADGTILKESAPTESEPGFYTLKSGKADPYLKSARDKGVKLSVLIFAGKNDVINQLLEDPIIHANTLVAEVKPLMQQYHFTDLNLDIEATGESSEETRINFGKFVAQVRQEMKREKLGTLTVEIAPYMLISRSTP